MQKFYPAIVFCCLLIGGSAGLIYLFYGEPLTLMDWSCLQLYLDIFKEAFRQGRMPFVLEQSTFSYGYVHSVNFLAYPSHWITPDALLAYALSPEKAVLIHTLLVFIAGNLALFWHARKTGLSLAAVCFLFLLLNFNGYIISHMAAGHYNWNNCYLIPVFLVLLLKMRDFSWQSPTCRFILFFMPCMFAFMIYSGSLYIVLYCMLFLAFTAIVTPKLPLPALAIAFLTFLCGAGYFFPASCYQTGYNFISGYPSLGVLLDAFTVNHDLYHKCAGMGWWEFSVYIGFSAFFLLAIALGRQFLIQRPADTDFLVLPACCLLLLSLGAIEKIFFLTHLPGSNIIRVATRLIIVPFMASLLLCAPALQDLLKNASFRRFYWIVLVFAAYEICRYNASIRMMRINKVWDKPELVVSFSENVPGLYLWLFYSGWLITLATISILLFLSFKIAATEKLSARFFKTLFQPAPDKSETY